MTIPAGKLEGQSIFAMGRKILSEELVDDLTQSRHCKTRLSFLFSPLQPAVSFFAIPRLSTCTSLTTFAVLSHAASHFLEALCPGSIQIPARVWILHVIRSMYNFLSKVRMHSRVVTWIEHHSAEIPPSPPFCWPQSPCCASIQRNHVIRFGSE